jgi:hypothetical protein
MRNYIRTSNPFSIAAPPAWFLQQLYVFDPMLVLFASLESPCYQVARRLSQHRYCKPSERHPDTTVFALHNLHPVGRLLPSPMTKWGPVILEDLRAMDVDAVGGGDKAADILDGFDNAERARVDLECDNVLDWWSGDAWRYLTERHHDQAEKGKGPTPSVPSIGKPNFRPGKSAVFVRQPLSGEQVARRRMGREAEPTHPPKIVTDVTLPAINREPASQPLP